MDLAFACINFATIPVSVIDQIVGLDSHFRTSFQRVESVVYMQACIMCKKNCLHRVLLHLLIILMISTLISTVVSFPYLNDQETSVSDNSLFSSYYRDRGLRQGQRFKRENKCLDQDTDRNSRICQNCAKITRAPHAYRKCCVNRRNAFMWCERIYEFSNSLG